MKGFKKYYFVVLYVFMLVLFAVACSDNDSQGSSDGEKTVLKAGSINSPTSIASIVANEMVEDIYDLTDGSLEIEYYDSEQLGNGEAQLENLRTGLQDMAVADPGWLADLDKDINIIGMPYAFRDNDHMEAFLESDTFEEIHKRIINDYGVRIVATNWYRAPRVLQTTKQIETPEDVEGLSWRVPDIPIFVEHAKQMGATPSPIAYGEVYMAFQQNLVEGHDPTLEEVYPMKFHEVAPYMLETESTYGLIFVLISEEVFQDLTEEHQEVIIDQAIKAGENHTEKVQDQLDEHREIMEEEGAVFTVADREAFREKVVPMVDRLEEEGFWSKGLFEEIQEIE